MKELPRYVRGQWLEGNVIIARNNVCMKQAQSDDIQAVAPRTISKGSQATKQVSTPIFTA